MVRVYPEMTDTKSLSLFHKGVRGQWSPADFDWTLEVKLDEHERTALAKLITPVYLGERTAMSGASWMIPQLMGPRDACSQMYLSTMMLDEARHFEALTRVYDRIERRPLELRELREMWQYHYTLLKSRSRVEWMWGILISDLFAKNFYTLFVKKLPNTLMAQLSAKILTDEARHQAFAEHYLQQTPMDQETRNKLIEMRDDLLRIMESLYKKLHDDTETLGIDGGEFFVRLSHDIERKMQRIGLFSPDQAEPLTDEDGETLVMDGGAPIVAGEV